MNLAYRLTQDAPLDLTIQTLLSGTHLNLGKRMTLVPGESKAFLFYDNVCVGVSDILHHSARGTRTAQIWIGPLRALGPEERREAGDTPRPIARGGQYTRSKEGK